MDAADFFDLIRSRRFEEAHKTLDAELDKAIEADLSLLNHRKVTVFLAEKRYDEALQHLIENRGQCGSVSHTHETIAMIYDITGHDDLALSELDSAPLEKEEALYPLLVADARFYRLFLRAKRGMPVTEQELDAFSADYETHLPANGHMRGMLVRKDDLTKVIQNY